MVSDAPVPTGCANKNNSYRKNIYFC